MLCVDDSFLSLSLSLSISEEKTLRIVWKSEELENQCISRFHLKISEHCFPPWTAGSAWGATYSSPRWPWRAVEPAATCRLTSGSPSRSPSSTSSAKLKWPSQYYNGVVSTLVGLPTTCMCKTHTGWGRWSWTWVRLTLVEFHCLPLGSWTYVLWPWSWGTHTIRVVLYSLRAIFASGRKHLNQGDKSTLI